MAKLPSFYKSENKDFTLIEGNCRSVLQNFEFKFDMIFADPPYFLSNGGFSISNGHIVCVDKGEWDKANSKDEVDEFNRSWITLCYDKLKDNGTIWISGTHHNIFSVAKILSELNFKIINVVTWAKTDPPQSIYHRTFTYSSEFVIWAKKSKHAFHKYNYELMCSLNNDQQMTDVWYMPAVQKWEKSCGKHPTQKPLPLLARIILASTKKGDWILDPFNGSGTTGIAASLLERKYLGIEKEKEFLELTAKRRTELENADVKKAYQEKILSECHSSCIANYKDLVLIGRIGSKEQKRWLFSSHKYNLPISKILSMPKILNAKYFLALCENNNTAFFKIGKLAPQIKTKKQIQSYSKNQYIPHRDNLYWVIFLVEEKSIDLQDKKFCRRNLISKQEERGAYWIKPLEAVKASFRKMK